MTELTNSKTWTKTRVTVTGASVIIANKKLLIAIKNQMISSGWVFVSSSNKVNSGGTDYWVSDTDIFMATEGTAHSWIVLQNSSIKTGFQICINMDISDSYARAASIYMSPSSGFSGGSITNRPVATDEVKVNVKSNWWFVAAANTTVSANVFVSSDLKCTHIFLYGGTTIDGIWIFDVPQNCPSWVDNKIVCMVNSSCLFSDYDSDAEALGTMKIKESRVLVCFGTLCLGTTCVPTYNGVVNATGDYGTNWPCTPMWLLSTNTSRPGQYGMIYDLWWAPTTTVTTGDYFPGGGSKTQFVFGNIVQGNDGTTVTL